MKKTFYIYAYKHPVKRDSVDIDVCEYIHKNQSLLQLLEEYPKVDYSIYIDGVLCGDELKTYKIESNVKKIELVPNIQFFSSIWAGLKWIGTYLLAAAPDMLLAFMFSYLGGLLFNQSPEETDSSGITNSNYAWNPSNTASQGIPRPRLYGEVMVYGNYTSRWTDVDDNDNEILYLVTDHGEGPIQGLGSNIIYLQDQASGNFTDVTTQERLGTMGQTCMTGFEKEKLEYSLNQEVLYANGWYTWTTPNNYTDDLEMTFSFPNGIMKYRIDGSTADHAVGFQIQISVSGLSSWTTIYSDSISGQQLSAKYVNIKFSDYIPSGFAFEYETQYDIRYKRTTVGGETRRIDAFYLKSIREVIDIAFTRPGRALIGVTALATSALSGDMTVKCVRQGRIINVYNGTSWVLMYSNNRAWVVFDILTMPIVSGTGESGSPYVLERYEGVDPSNIDTAFFYEWAEFCDDTVSDGKGGTHARFVCNYNVDTKTNILDLAYTLADLGRAKLYWEGTTLTGWLDATVDTVTDLVTCDNIMAKSWRNAWTQPSEMAGTINVYYRDEDNGYERTFYPYSDEDSGLYTRIIEVEGSGETRWAGNVRNAVFALDRNRLLKNANEFQMHKDAMRYSLGDVLQIQNRVPDWGTHYRVVEVDSSAQIITFDRDVSAVEDDLVYVRAYDDSSGVDDVVVESYTVASVSGKGVTLKEILDPIPVKDDIVAVASSTGASTTVLRRIIKIGQLVNNYYDISVETYTTELFDNDDLDPSKPNPDYVWPAPVKATGLSELEVNWQNIISLVNTTMPPQPDIETPWISNVSWDVDSSGTVAWSATSANDDITFRYQGTTYVIVADDYTPGSGEDPVIFYWDPNFTTIFRETADANTAIASGNWPVAVLIGGVIYPATPMQLIWGGLILAGTIRAESYAELRQTPQIIDGDSCDATHPFVMDFKIPSEMTSIISVKLSFKIRDFRAYSTGVAAGGGTTSTATAGAFTDLATTGTSDWDWASATGDIVGSPDTDSDAYSSGTTDNQNNSHYHTVSTTHSHDISGDTGNGDGDDGIHDHPLTRYDVDCSSESSGNTNNQSSDHKHTFTAPTHAHGIGSHTHDLSGLESDHTHTLDITGHTHTMGDHTHTMAFGIYEETNATTINLYCNNGSGYGSAVGPYSADQTDLDLIVKFDSVGWKSIMFTSTSLVRIKAILELKFDITA